MSLALIGPLTSLIEGTAAAVGAGTLLGGFALSLPGLVLGWPRSKIEARAFEGGYLGGIAGIAIMLIDIMVRYIV